MMKLSTKNTHKSSYRTKSKTQKVLRGEKKLVDEWKGTLLGEAITIQIFTQPNSKRKPIIKINAKNTFKNIEGPFISLTFIPHTKEHPDFTGKIIYRLLFHYRSKGSYQDGPKVAFIDQYVLFSDSEEKINEIGKMLSKHTKDIKYKKI